ncbi:MAG: hypothetical protein J0I09_04555 [Sphingobacteriia bacterium]|nr:hypothetical protein [Sphingobacteriia bacterium]
MKKILALCFGIIAFAIVQAQTDSTSKELLGKYRFPDGSVIADVTVSHDNGALVMSSSAGNSALEKTEAADTYTIVSFQGIAVFKRNDARKIVGVVIDAMGYHLEGIKDDAAIRLQRELYPMMPHDFILQRIK